MDDLVGVVGFKVFDLNVEFFGGKLVVFVGVLVKVFVGFVVGVVGYFYVYGLC